MLDDYVLIHSLSTDWPTSDGDGNSWEKDADLKNLFSKLQGKVSDNQGADPLDVYFKHDSPRGHTKLPPNEMYKPGDQAPPKVRGGKNRAHFSSSGIVVSGSGEKRKEKGDAWLPPLGCRCDQEKNAEQVTCHLESMLYGDRRRWCKVLPGPGCPLKEFAYCNWREWDKSEKNLSIENIKASKKLDKERAQKRSERRKNRALYEVRAKFQHNMERGTKLSKNYVDKLQIANTSKEAMITAVQMVPEKTKVTTDS